MRYKVITQSRTVRTYYVNAANADEARVLIEDDREMRDEWFDDIDEPDGEEVVSVREAPR